jgi:ribosomal peptide maturation radical SAM protein 1
MAEWTLHRATLGPASESDRPMGRPEHPLWAERGVSVITSLKDSVVASRSVKQLPLRVALVNMPFSSSRFPSMQIGLLQSILAGRCITATALYLNLEFAARIGWNLYESLSNETLYFIGDWMFASEAFREDAPDGKLFLKRFATRLSKDRLEWFWHQRTRGAREFLERCLASVPWHHYDVVGFSSVFVQNAAALALGRLLKERHPHLITVFGGANFDDEMGLEYVRALPWIDYAVLGEADETFPALLERLADSEAITAMPGVAHAKNGQVDYGGPSPLLRDLDSLPIPNYDDYFATAARLRMPNALVANGTQIPFETARGCWWGEKHHCTFCGLNAMGMSYRSKSPARILDEIDALTSRYKTRYLGAVDNILDHRHIEGVFGVLAAQRKDYKFFYEVKANLRREQIRLLAAGGIRRIQPGIESLNTHILKLMRKGVTGIKNVRLLKWATYYRMGIAWNLLLGFPGETQEDYEQQLDLIKQLSHLPPPAGAFRISLQRFSPNFTQATTMGFDNVRPVESYGYIYPRAIDTRRVAYFFEYNAKDTLPETVYTPIRTEITRWQERWRGKVKPSLTYAIKDGRLSILDARRPEAPRAHKFDRLGARIYEFCGDTDRSVDQVREHLSDEMADENTVQGFLGRFVMHGLMCEEDGTFLSLALPKQRGL